MELTEQQKKIADEAVKTDWNKPGGSVMRMVYTACEAVLESRAASDQGLRKAAQDAVDIWFKPSLDRGVSLNTTMRNLKGALTQQDGKGRERVTDPAVEAVESLFGHAFDSHGERCRDVPLTPEQVVAAVRKADAQGGKKA